jgi:hypothetical protein
LNRFALGVLAVRVLFSTAIAPFSGAFHMTLSIAHLQPGIALLAGILILIAPRLLNYIVAIYLIVVGILGLGFIKM